MVEGLWVINDGSRFVVSFEENNKINLSFCTNEQEAICDVPIHLYVDGDIKYFVQMLGREGMSTSCCMYCQTHPNDWKGLQSVPDNILWGISKQRQSLPDTK
jgi:hypothetical protein